MMVYQNERLTIFSCCVIIIESCNHTGSISDWFEAFAVPYRDESCAGCYDFSSISNPKCCSSMEGLVQRPRRSLTQPHRHILQFQFLRRCELLEKCL